MNQPNAAVRLTEPAIVDLRSLFRRDPQIARRCLSKILLLERSPEAGEPLLGGLIRFRRLTISGHRIVWRVTASEAEGTVIDIAEVRATGARADAEVYAELNRRSQLLGDTYEAQSLRDMVSIVGRLSENFERSAPPPSSASRNGW